MAKRPQFTDLPEGVQYGNGCGLYARFLNVPDFIFTASCNHHDFNYQRGCGANHWYENLWKAPFWYTKANVDFFTHMLRDAYAYRGSDLKSLMYMGIALIYFVGVMLFSWPWFTTGPWRSLSDITGIKDL